MSYSAFPSLISEQINVVVVQRRARQQHTMRMIRHRGNRVVPMLMQRPSRIRLEARQERAVHIERFDVVPVAPDGEDRSVLMHAQRAHRVRSGLDLADGLVHT